ncbi:decaprenyl-phosphate phosphoribosyltransferase [Methylococcales bacterium]|nr:decaprenyl-phosphate phosphoribosyltransferase [Methylococcales bacterium]
MTKIADLIKLCRPHQWTKNVFCLAGLVLSKVPVDIHAIVSVALVVGAFCLLSSAVYVLNDIVDVERDRAHPKKKNRPIASGRVSAKQAATLFVALLLVSLSFAATLPVSVIVCLLLYLMLNVAYSLRLKHVAVLDVFCISLGFLLRLSAGVYVIGDIPTTWIMLCGFFLTLFIGFAKRRTELAVTADILEQRPVLDYYSVDYLDFLVSASSTMAIVSYAVFTTTGGRDPILTLTVLPVVYAVFHYKRTMMIGGGSEEPDRILLRDRAIWICVILWLAIFFAASHFQPEIFR